jgi:hypothetical protein
MRQSKKKYRIDRQKLIANRNKKICERFKYWSEDRRRRIDDVLQILSQEEFFLSETTIWNIVKNNQGS